MARYTLEISQIAKDKNFKIFDFEYKFYDDNLKPEFEKQFIDHFYYNEIGFETVARFKQRLKSFLNDIYPKYHQLYLSELASKDINFLLNKDLTEKYIKETNVKRTDESKTDSNTENNSVTNSNDNTDYKESNVDNGNSSVDINDLTSISNNKNNSSTNTTDNNNSSSLYKLLSDNVERETNILESKGNIGITSSAELLQKWRDTFLNLNLSIFEEAREYDLFMTIY